MHADNKKSTLNLKYYVHMQKIKFNVHENRMFLAFPDF